ncbi:hypothetical protein GS982_20445 [Rhodococcus hoagii]|nr:hypothetical protein [Prescottella equi]NKZ84565.1 hypothetical protein [Prescottella equi]
MDITTQDRIVAAANRLGWTPKNDSHYGGMVFTRRSRKVWVTFDVRGRIAAASEQTGSYGGRRIEGRDRAGRVLASLAR